MSESIFAGRTFTAPPERTARLAELFLRHVNHESPLRVLDLGCGTGEQITALVPTLPKAAFVGIDISEDNIAMARDSSAGFAERVSFDCTDYLQFSGGSFDAILSDSVLQNLTVESAVLYDKLAADLRPGGLLAITIPYRCVYNTVLWAARRLLKKLRGPRFEAAALAIAARVHPNWDVGLLRERLPYLYLLPERADGVEMRAALAQRGLVLSEAVELAHVSLAQPRHRFLAFRKNAR